MFSCTMIKNIVIDEHGIWETWQLSLSGLESLKKKNNSPLSAGIAFEPFVSKQSARITFEPVVLTMLSTLPLPDSCRRDVASDEPC